MHKCDALFLIKGGESIYLRVRNWSNNSVVSLTCYQLVLNKMNKMRHSTWGTNHATVLLYLLPRDHDED